MIVSFRDKRTENLFLRNSSRHFPADVIERGRRKLFALDAAIRLDDLRVPPSNRLEALKADRQGQHSIRINVQWRVYFVWHDGNAHDVEFCDYH